MIDECSIIYANHDLVTTIAGIHSIFDGSVQGHSFVNRWMWSTTLLLASSCGWKSCSLNWTSLTQNLLQFKEHHQLILRKNVNYMDRRCRARYSLWHAVGFCAGFWTLFGGVPWDPKSTACAFWFSMPTPQTSRTSFKSHLQFCRPSWAMTLQTGQAGLSSSSTKNNVQSMIQFD